MKPIIVSRSSAWKPNRPIDPQREDAAGDRDRA